MQRSNLLDLASIPRILLSSGAAALLSGATAAAQTTFSIDYKGPTIGVPSPGPITEADVLMPVTGFPALGPLPPPIIVIPGGALGLPAWPGVRRAPPRNCLRRRGRCAELRARHARHARHAAGQLQVLGEPLVRGVGGRGRPERLLGVADRRGPRGRVHRRRPGRLALRVRAPLRDLRRRTSASTTVTACRGRAPSPIRGGADRAHAVRLRAAQPRRQPRRARRGRPVRLPGLLLARRRRARLPLRLPPRRARPSPTAASPAARS